LELSRRFHGTPIRFEEMLAALEDVDIVISSTGSTDFVVTHAQVKGLLRKRRNRPLFFIDIAVPRDIDPKINRLSNIYVYDIDDLKGVIDENIEDRRREAVKGERLVDEAVVSFRKWHDSLEVVPTIKALRKKLEEIAAAEIAKTLHSENMPADARQAIERMTQALINKILHDPTDVLKRNGCQSGRSAYLDIARKLFKLE